MVGNNILSGERAGGRVGNIKKNYAPNKKFQRAVNNNTIRPIIIAELVPTLAIILQLNSKCKYRKFIENVTPTNRTIFRRA